MTMWVVDRCMDADRNLGWRVRWVFGHIDELGECIRGWVSDGTGHRLRVVCRIDGAWQAEAVADQFRADVRDAGFGDGYSEFSLRVPEALCDGQERGLEILVPERAGWMLPGCPMRVVLGMPEASVRRVGNDEAAAYAEFWMRHLQNEHDFPPSPEAYAVFADNLRTLIVQPRSAVFAVWIKSRIVGFCGLEAKIAPGYQHVAVLRIALLGPYRGKRLGGRLLEAVLAFAGDAGLRRVELTVNVNNQRARRLYQRFGFQEEGVLRDSYYDGRHYSDELVMARILGGEGLTYRCGINPFKLK